MVVLRCLAVKIGGRPRTELKLHRKSESDSGRHTINIFGQTRHDPTFVFFLLWVQTVTESPDLLELCVFSIIMDF